MFNLRVLSWNGEAGRVWVAHGLQTTGSGDWGGKKEACSWRMWPWKMWWGQFCSSCPQSRCTTSENGNILKANQDVGRKTRFCSGLGDLKVLPKAKCNSVCSPLPFSTSFCFLLSKSSRLSQFLFFFFFHTHREPDSSSAEKLVKQIFWLYYKSVVICFPFPLTIYICLPAWLYLERGRTLKPFCTNQNKMTQHTITYSIKVFAVKIFSFWQYTF